MKLQRTALTFNLGDTSFRRKTLIDDYKILLPFLAETNNKFVKWEGGEGSSQAYFYKRILEDTDLFERNTSEDFAKRGRTLTNALVKIGFTNEERKLSNVANAWMNSWLVEPGPIEKLFNLDITNILFTRQLLKLRIYSHNEINYFYPFRVALNLLAKYSNIPQIDFLTILHLIEPTYSNVKIEEIINSYKSVQKGDKIFSEYLEECFPDSDEIPPHANPKDLFGGAALNRENFNLLFTNRKSSEVQKDYYEFVSTLVEFKLRPNKDIFKKLVKLSKSDKIKKAFGFGKSVFISANTYSEFLNVNEENELLQKDNTKIYYQFLLSKKDDIVREYRDMTKRTFNLSGLIDFSNGLVNASNRELFKSVFKHIKLAGEANYDSYERDLESEFYQNNQIEQILSLDVNRILNELKLIYDVEDISDIEDAVAIQKEEKFIKLISEKFPREKIIEMLPLFSSREDEKIKNIVTESALVPTIYEYIIAIAWYHISDEKFFITKSLNLTLDGNLLPLSHATGGAGDIVINYKDYILMLEVTLMNKNAQKRGEWEPVLRHATNLTVDNPQKDVTTLFIADELDENTINIWHAIASVPLKSSKNNEYAEMVKIFPLTNQNLLTMLDSNDDLIESKLISNIDKSYSKLKNQFNSNWRNEILEDVI